MAKGTNPIHVLLTCFLSNISRNIAVFFFLFSSFWFGRTSPYVKKNKAEPNSSKKGTACDVTCGDPVTHRKQIISRYLRHPEPSFTPCLHFLRLICLHYPELHVLNEPPQITILRICGCESLLHGIYLKLFCTNKCVRRLIITIFFSCVPGPKRLWWSVA